MLSQKFSVQQVPEQLDGGVGEPTVFSCVDRGFLEDLKPEETGLGSRVGRRSGTKSRKNSSGKLTSVKVARPRARLNILVSFLPKEVST